MQKQKVETSEKCRKVNQWQNGAIVAMNNQTPSFLSLDRYHNWAGIPSIGSFPTIIPPKGQARFTHLRGGQYGSVACVQYSGINANGVTCAWVLAWEAPVQDSPPCPPNRVYVACGTKSTMDAMTWDEIIASLDNSPTTDIATDWTTKTSAQAVIEDLTPNTATLCGYFCLIN